MCTANVWWRKVSCCYVHGRKIFSNQSHMLLNYTEWWKWPTSCLSQVMALEAAEILNTFVVNGIIALTVVRIFNFCWGNLSTYTYISHWFRRVCFWIYIHETLQKWWYVMQKHLWWKMAWPSKAEYYLEVDAWGDQWQQHLIYECSQGLAYKMHKYYNGHIILF